MREFINIVESAEQIGRIDQELARQILADWRCKRGVKIGKNTRLWRGQSSQSGSGMAVLGLGLYFTANKKVAKGYAGDDGEIVEIPRWKLPHNALRFDTTGNFEIWLQQAQRLLGVGPREFSAVYHDFGDFIRALDPEIGGIQIHTGKDAMFVSYSTD